MQKKEYEKAVDYHNSALNIYTVCFGPDHFFNCAAYTAIGYCYNFLNDTQGALDLFQRALRIAVAVFGENHVETSTCYNNVGVAYHTIGNLPLATVAHQQALRIRTTLLGKDNPVTAKSQQWLNVCDKAKTAPAQAWGK